MISRATCNNYYIFACLYLYINAFDIGISLDTTERLRSIGNSSQKVRQYVACGKPVVSGTGGNSFLEQEGLGFIVDPEDIGQIAGVIVNWLSLSDDEKKAYSKRAVHYAQRNLSVRRALDDRFDFWNRRLKLYHNLTRC
jgi:glycosyltransferase involved in cell wall biosynthesis